MTAAAFDGSTYRRTVLTPLRSAAPASVDDLFWLGHVPRETDDDAQIAALLKSTKAFLNKEKSRPRQADVAAAVLREWGRVEGVLGDAAARASLRARLGDAPPGAEVVGAEGAPGAAASPGPGAGLDPAARRRRQVATALGELARLRDEPELAEDLFAFLGLPVTATSDMLRARVEKVGEINRKRRPDRERSLVDELLMHCRELLVDGDPATYRAGLSADAAGAAAPGASEPSAAAPPQPVVDIPETFVGEDGTVQPVSPPPWNGPPPGAADPLPAYPLPGAAEPARPTQAINYTRPPRRTPGPPAPEPDSQPSAAADGAGPPPVSSLQAVREDQGVLRVTWDWPAGVTEVFVAVGAGADPESAGPPSRKLTNTKYELDGGALLDGVAAGTPLRVFSGMRDQAGRLSWAPTAQSPETIAP